MHCSRGRCSAEGLFIATTDATPGADPKFLIRGGSSINQSNDPIVLVDGVVREMAGLNPNDIESVSFLKDAAAAGVRCEPSFARTPGKIFLPEGDKTTGFLRQESREIGVYAVGVTSEWNR